ncbi:MAG: hypothetical protein ACRDH2_06495 [Anaerolineales bacterium]
MEIGMLWYDADGKRKLDEKVTRAADYYKTKYGAPPTVCYVHPSMLSEKPGIAASDRLTVAGVQLRPARSVLANHFWLGVDDVKR